MLEVLELLGFHFSTIDEALAALEGLAPGITQQYKDLKILLSETLNSIPQVAGDYCFSL